MQTLAARTSHPNLSKPFPGDKATRPRPRGKAWASTFACFRACAKDGQDGFLGMPLFDLQPRGYTQHLQSTTFEVRRTRFSSTCLPTVPPVMSEVTPSVGHSPPVESKCIRHRTAKHAINKRKSVFSKYGLRLLMACKPGLSQGRKTKESPLVAELQRKDSWLK